LPEGLGEGRLKQPQERRDIHNVSCGVCDTPSEYVTHDTHLQAVGQTNFYKRPLVSFSFLHFLV
jgi:hypothetical protein